MHKSYVLTAATITLASLYTLLLRLSPANLPVVAPFEDTPGGSIANLAIFLMITTVSGIAILALQRRPQLLRILMVGSILYLSYASTLIYVDVSTHHQVVPGPVRAATVILAPLIPPILILYSIVVNSQAIYSAAMLISISGAGVLLENMLPPLTKIAFLLGYAAFDYFSVSRGILRRMISRGGGGLSLFILSIGGIGVGIGDILLYSFLVSFSIAMLEPYWWLGIASSSAAIIAGHWINISMLAKYKVIPGLPAPILIGLGLLAITKLLIQA